jgi:hypothetical protein
MQAYQKKDTREKIPEEIESREMIKKRLSHRYLQIKINSLMWRCLEVAIHYIFLSIHLIKMCE